MITRLLPAFALAFTCLSPRPGVAQIAAEPAASPLEVDNLDSLVARARTVSPTLRAARHRVDAARARLGPASALPDPMVGVGIMNFPVTNPGFGDDMTMKTLSVAQTLPYPGKRSLARASAERAVEAADARLQMADIDLRAAVREAYLDLAFTDRAVEVLEGRQQVLVALVQLSESRYAAGGGSQRDVLSARAEASAPALEAAAFGEERRAALARLNGLLERASDTPVGSPRIPERFERAAVPLDPSRIRFATASLGARAADSPLPPLEVVQERAVENSPVVRARRAEIAAQAALVELAGKAHLPDFEVSLQYGQRRAEPDMASFMVSAPIPVHRGDRQAQELVGAQAELAAVQADERATINQLRSDVAEGYAAVERDRTHIALLLRSVIPQGRAALEAATVSFQAGQGDLGSLIASQATLFEYEAAFHRALTDFAKGMIELERLVGAEVVP